VPPRNPSAQKMWKARPPGAIATTGSRGVDAERDGAGNRGERATGIGLD
jgi:hypothetical protein